MHAEQPRQSRRRRRGRRKRRLRRAGWPRWRLRRSEHRHCERIGDRDARCRGHLHRARRRWRRGRITAARRLRRLRWQRRGRRARDKRRLRRRKRRPRRSRRPRRRRNGRAIPWYCIRGRRGRPTESPRCDCHPRTGWNRRPSPHAGSRRPERRSGRGPGARRSRGVAVTRGCNGICLLIALEGTSLQEARPWHSLGGELQRPRCFFS